MRSRARTSIESPDTQGNLTAHRMKCGPVIALRAKRTTESRAGLYAGNMVLNLGGHDSLLQAGKLRSCFCYCQSHGCSGRPALPDRSSPPRARRGSLGTTSTTALILYFKN